MNFITVCLLASLLIIATPFAAPAQTATSSNILFELDEVIFQTPLAAYSVSDVIDHSLGAIDKLSDIELIKDGLPHFGANRDDWKDRLRLRFHQGYDIYAQQTEVLVLAAASGEVEKIGHGRRSGPYIKLLHEQNLHTLYIHLGEILVKKGQRVRRGEVIGKIIGATGNALVPQLHFELKHGQQSLDPLFYIKRYHAADNALISKILSYERNLQKMIRKRNALVRFFRQRNSAENN